MQKITCSWLVSCGAIVCLIAWPVLATAQSGCDSTRIQAVPPVGVLRTAVIQRATYSYNVASCQSCPSDSETRSNPFDCTCFISTIPHLKNEGLNKDIRFNIRYAVLDNVAPSSTKNLIVAFAGQNGSSAGSVSGGGPSNLTGQPDHWQDRCNDGGCGTQTFNRGSLTGTLLGSDVLGTANTHAVVFVDHQYDWGRSENEKIANGITSYLRTLVTSSVVKNIVITGHSRGGCLALTVARKLWWSDPSLRDIRLIVLPLDAVCNPDRSTEENWTSKTTTDDNPLKSDTGWFGWHSSYPAYGLGQNACVANVVGGENFWSLHALAFGPDPTTGDHRFNNWWTVYQHVPLGAVYDADHIKDGVGSFYYFVKNNMVGKPPLPCGPGNCPGCCASGTCEAGSSATACGAGGLACKVCSAPTNASSSCKIGNCGWACNSPYHDCGDGRCVRTVCQ